MKTLCKSRCVCVLTCVFATAAQAQLAGPPVMVLAPGLSRIEGTNVDNKVAYTRIFLTGTLMPTLAMPTAAESAPLTPTFTAQCTQNPDGRLFFEVFANFGGVDDTSYHRPWRPGDGGQFPPSLPTVNITMEFLGYTHVKPVKRQWERLNDPSGQFRYNPPAMRSANMEEFSYYLQYLRALPTLRLSVDGKTAEFHVVPLLEQIGKEPRCAAARI